MNRVHSLTAALIALLIASPAAAFDIGSIDLGQTTQFATSAALFAAYPTSGVTPWSIDFLDAPGGNVIDTIDLLLDPAEVTDWDPGALPPGANLEIEAILGDYDITSTVQTLTLNDDVDVIAGFENINIVQFSTVAAPSRARAC